MIPSAWRRDCNSRRRRGPSSSVPLPTCWCKRKSRARRVPILPLDVASVPVSAYEIRGLRHRRGGVVGRGTGVLSPFVGRDQDMALLQARLAQAIRGHGQVVGIAGEPGIGKSRLLAEFRQHLTGQPVQYYEGHCMAYSQATPYLPVLDILRQCCGITDADPAAVVTTKVHQALQTAGLAPEVEAPMLLLLLDIPVEPAQLAGLSPAALKARAFALLRHLSLPTPAQPARILAVENVHWIDPTSEEWLASLVERLAGVPLLLLVTYRPGYRPPWLAHSAATQLALTPLSPDCWLCWPRLMGTGDRPRPGWGSWPTRWRWRTARASAAMRPRSLG